jgi:hypothetical protein
MRLHVLSEFRIEAFEAQLVEFIVEDLILALQQRSSRIIIGDEFVEQARRENPKLKYHYDLELTRQRVSAEFISEYLAQLAREGKADGQEGMCAAIRQDIADIDRKIEEAEQEKERKRKLIMVLEHLGDTSYRRQRLGSGDADVEVPEDDSDEAKQTQRKIIKLFDEHEALTNVEIRTKSGCGNDRLVIRAIKRLGELNILDRDRSTKELKIIRGKEFDRAEELLVSS